MHLGEHEHGGSSTDVVAMSVATLDCLPRGELLDVVAQLQRKARAQKKLVNKWKTACGRLRGLKHKLEVAIVAKDAVLEEHNFVKRSRHVRRHHFRLSVSGMYKLGWLRNMGHDIGSQALSDALNVPVTRYGVSRCEKLLAANFLAQARAKHDEVCEAMVAMITNCDAEDKHCAHHARSKDVEYSSFSVTSVRLLPTTHSNLLARMSFLLFPLFILPRSCS